MRKNLFSSTNRIILSAVVPAIIFFGTFYYGVIIYALYISFHKAPLGKVVSFVGFANYIKVLTDDPLFYEALRNTFYYAIVAVFIGTFLSLLLAVAVNRVGKSIGKIFQVIYFLPIVSTIVAVSLVWQWLYQAKFGLINQVIRVMISEVSPRWLISPSSAMPAVIIMTIWRGLGYNMVIILAGLQGIPKTFCEAATIDGANRWHVFRHITIPLLKPTLAFVLIMGTISGLQAFAEMYVLFGAPGSGPLNSTRTIVVHLYERAFSYYKMGSASAIAFVLFVIILIIAIVQLRLLRTKWRY